MKPRNMVAHIPTLDPNSRLESFEEADREIWELWLCVAKLNDLVATLNDKVTTLEELRESCTSMTDTYAADTYEALKNES